MPMINGKYVDPDTIKWDSPRVSDRGKQLEAMRNGTYVPGMFSLSNQKKNTTPTTPTTPSGPSKKPPVQTGGEGGYPRPSTGGVMLPQVQHRDPITGEELSPSEWYARQNGYPPYGGGMMPQMPDYMNQISQLQSQLAQLAQRDPWEGFFEKLQQWQAQQEQERRKRESMFDWNKVLWGGMYPGAGNGYGYGNNNGLGGSGGGYVGGFPFFGMF
jgi:hypothetical protein